MSSGAYYTIGVAADRVESSAFYALDPVDGLNIMQGGFSCYPSQPSFTSVSIYPQVAQMTLPASEYISGSVTIQTISPAIAGKFTASPAVNSAITLTLYGAGGKVLGTATLEAGQTTVSFDWSVGAGQGMSASEAQQIGQNLLKQK